MTKETHSKEQEQGLIIVKSLLNKPAKETVELIKISIENGESDPAYVGVVLKKFAKVQELANKNSVIKENIYKSTIEYRDSNSKTFNLYGAKITIADTGYWDFSNTDDPYLTKLKEIEKTIKAFIKDREDELKKKAIIWESKNNPLNVQKFGVRPFKISWEELPNLDWDEGYGEVDTNPPTKKGRETLRYSL